MDKIWRRACATCMDESIAVIVRYADDAVLGFPRSDGRSEEQGSRGPLIFWVSPTSAGPATRRGISRCTTTTGKWLVHVVRGYFQYHAIPGNWARLEAFRNGVQRIWFQTLRRRSQRSRLTWERFRQGLGSLLPPIQILQALPERAIRRQTP